MRYIILCAALIAAGVDGAAAQTPSAYRLADLTAADVRSARVLVMSFATRTRVAVTEASLPDMACGLSGGQELDLAALLAILQQRIAIPVDEQLPTITLRGAVYLSLRDGAQVRLLMGPGGDGTVTGSYRVVPGRFDHFSGDRYLVPALSRWILDHAERAHIDRSTKCESIETVRKRELQVPRKPWPDFSAAYSATMIPATTMPATTIPATDVRSTTELVRSSR